MLSAPWKYTTESFVTRTAGWVATETTTAARRREKRYHPSLDRSLYLESLLYRTQQENSPFWAIDGSARTTQPWLEDSRTASSRELLK